jgi:hypothetical protein
MAGGAVEAGGITTADGGRSAIVIAYDHPGRRNRLRCNRRQCGLHPSGAAPPGRSYAAAQAEPAAASCGAVPHIRLSIMKAADLRRSGA